MENEKKTTDLLVTVIGGVVLIAAVAVFVLPLIGGRRCDPSTRKQALAGSMISNLKYALAEYRRDFGVYPPSYANATIDKPSEALYYFTAGCDVTSPDAEIDKKLKQQRANTKVYLDYKSKELADFDGDGYYELIDPWGNPYMYVTRNADTKSGLGEKTASGFRPFHNMMTYDIYSVGPDGKTGTNWRTTDDMLECSVHSGNSFYRQAADQVDDGTDKNDINNF